MEWFFYYKGIEVQQHENVAVFFKKLFEIIKPKRILEIGTSYGGLTIILRDLLNDLSMFDTKIRTYDIFNSNKLSKINNIDIIIKNVFNDNYTELIDEELISYINDVGPTIVLCDGHHKKEEFNILSKYLKCGDIIMAHDYSPNIEYFNNINKDKIWDWCEIIDLDVEDCSSLYGLYSFMYEDFRSVVWLCKIHTCNGGVS